MKKCKFCGGDGAVLKEGLSYYAKCQGCMASTFYVETEEEAVILWNKMIGGDDCDNSAD